MLTNDLGLHTLERSMRSVARLLRTYGYSEYVARESSVSFSQRLLREAFAQTRAKLLDDTPESTFVRTQLFTGKQQGEQQFADYDLQKLVFDIIDYVRNRNLPLGELVILTQRRRFCRY